MTSSPPVLVLLLSWNDVEGVLTALGALALQSYPAIEVLVIDNGSEDGTVEQVRAEHPEVEILELGHNSGFTGGTNAGFREAARRGFPYVFAHNQDVVCPQGTISQLVQALEADPRAAVANPTVLYAHQPHIVHSAGGFFDWRRGSTPLRGMGEVERGQFGDEPSEVDFAPLCATLMRMEAIERCGALDERFFAYYEDCEWSVRAGRAGYRILHVPAASVFHGLRHEVRDASVNVHYYMTRNRLLFLKLSGASRRVRARVLVTEYARTLASWTLRRRWRHRRPQRNAMLRAIFDYLWGRNGPVEAPRRSVANTTATSPRATAK